MTVMTTPKKTTGAQRNLRRRAAQGRYYANALRTFAVALGGLCVFKIIFPDVDNPLTPEIQQKVMFWGGFAIVLLTAGAMAVRLAARLEHIAENEQDASRTLWRLRGLELLLVAFGIVFIWQLGR